MKAQYSDVMMLLVGAVFAVALLIMIYSAVESIEPPLIGSELVKELGQKAYKNQGMCFGGDKIPFNKGELLQLDNFISGVTFTLSGEPTFIDSTDAPTLMIKIKVTTPVSVKCTSISECTLYLTTKECQ